MEDVYFIDRDGNKVSAEGISSHIGLAFEILKHSKTFQEQFNLRSNATFVFRWMFWQTNTGTFNNNVVIFQIV